MVRWPGASKGEALVGGRAVLARSGAASRAYWSADVGSLSAADLSSPGDFSPSLFSQFAANIS